MRRDPYVTYEYDTRPAGELVGNSLLHGEAVRRSGEPHALVTFTSSSSGTAAGIKTLSVYCRALDLLRLRDMLTEILDDWK